MTELIEQPRLTIRRISVSSMDNNVYLLTERATGQQLLIDAANEPDAIAALVSAAGGDAAVPTRLEFILTTHSHRDHVGALAAIASAHPEAEALAGAEDADVITAATGVPIARRLEHGDTIRLGGVELKVIGLRGHTPGSIAVAYSEPDQPTHVFTGDSLFPGGVGDTNRDPERFSTLFSDVVSRIFEVYRENAVVHPGHGAATTLCGERPHLAEWEARGW
ncbi:MAG TPA: MBL fold metallo-hydrolase [Propionicimonas sp.]|nr:MBL fold metallo-hydrolase [Propionicimonas sp.]HRA06660.1 MBL fold metallo-hydrolase [Propionicimonas sp.]